MSTEYEKLAAPFDKTFKKPGTSFDYLTGEQIVTRLNEELGWNAWAFEIVEHGYHLESDSVWVKGRLTSGGVVKEQFGGQAHNRTRDGKIIDVGNDLKGAATDALKKCATLIGVGLYLSEKEGGHEAQKPAQAPQRAATPAKPSLVDWIRENLGFTAEDTIALSRQMFDGKEPDKLGKEQKQRLVVELENRKKKEAAA